MNVLKSKKKKKIKKRKEKRIKKVVQSHHKLFTNTNSFMETRDLNLTPALHSENYNLNNKKKKKRKKKFYTKHMVWVVLSMY